MSDYGIKVLKEGADINTTDVREVLLSSKYPMLQYHSDNTGSVTFNAGDSEKYVDFEHNLGYVSAYISYMEWDNKLYFINVLRASELGAYGYSWADASKVRCGFYYGTPGYNTVKVIASGSADYYNDYADSNAGILVGNVEGNGYSGALRFGGITIPKNASIQSATLNYQVGGKGGGTGNMKIDTYGIDEDNTVAFSGSPMGRTSTTAHTTQNVSLPPEGEYFGINVKTIVEEISSRNGWSSGNAMSFKIYNDSSPTNVYAQDTDNYPSEDNSYLEIVLTGTQTISFRTIIFKNKIA
jgi:hypothetical protein